jgi:death on curing protein
LPTSDKPDEPFLSLEALVWMHTVAVEEFGGSAGIRDRGLLESALARPLATFGDKNLYETPFKRGAALAESLVMNHGFVDGNKRTAMYAMAAWLEREGHAIDAARGEVRDLALAIASHGLTTEQIAEWLIEHALGRRSGIS